MALTPDQKKRLAALDSGPEGFSDGPDGPDGAMSSTVKSVRARFQAASIRAIAIKALIALALIGFAVYFIVVNQLHMMDFKAIFSSGDGSPISRFSDGVKLQRKKARLLDEGYGHLLVGEYDKAFKTAKEVRALDGNDPQPKELIGRTVDAVAQRATRSFESGEIEAALRDVRTALRYRRGHAAANALYSEIADRLMLEAEAHHEKKEYAELITKAKEVQKIDQSNMAATTLLIKANEELLAEASILFVTDRYSEALSRVQLSLIINPEESSNPGAHRLLNQITSQIASPELELSSISTFSGTSYAHFRLSGFSKRVQAKEGEIVSNFRVIKIDPEQKAVVVQQIYTGKMMTILQRRAK